MRKVLLAALAVVALLALGVLLHTGVVKSPSAQESANAISGVSPATGAAASAPAMPAAGATASAIATRPNPEAKHFASSEEFQSFTAATLQKLPRIADFKKLKPEEAHETPQIIRDAGKKLGDVAAALQADPSLAPVAFHFYTDCAKGQDLPPSIRALCYVHYVELGPTLKENIDPAIVPADVKELAENLKF